MSEQPPRLPIKQLIILSICRFAEPVALQSVIPYLPEMIESLGVAEESVGRWVGIVAAVFSVTQCFTGLLWSRASDRYGRKPTILTGLLVTMLASLIFGFSKTLRMAIVARAIAGGCSGTVGILRTTVAEMVTSKELQPRAFSVMPLVWSVGSIIGPMLGGILAKPATKYPALFGGSAILKEYPYAFPNIVICSLFIVGLISGFLFLEETLERKKYNRDYGLRLGDLLTKPCRGPRTKPRWYQDQQIRAQSKTQSLKVATSPNWREVLTPQSNLNLLAYCILALHSIAYDQLIPVFLHHKVQKDRAHNPNVHLPFKFSGGFGLESGRIGLIFTVYGAIILLVQFFCFPPLARRYGVLNCLRACTMTFPIAYFLTPFAVLIENPTIGQLAVFSIMLIKAAGVVFAFPCVTIMLTNSALSLRLLATLNGLSVSVSALARAAGPYIIGYLFDAGDRIGYIILPWWVLGFIGVAGNVCTYWLVEMDGLNSQNRERETNEDDNEAHEAQTLAGDNPDIADQATSTSVAVSDEQLVDIEDDSYSEDAPLLSR